MIEISCTVTIESFHLMTFILENVLCAFNYFIVTTGTLIPVLNFSTVLLALDPPTGVVVDNCTGVDIPEVIVAETSVVIKCSGLFQQLQVSKEFVIYKSLLRLIVIRWFTKLPFICIF
jgi:hypothetical protein